MKRILLAIVSLVACLSAYAEQVEVTYFHGKQRCPTCLAIEKYSSELIADEYKNSKDVKFRIVDISTEEGQKMAEEYKISWSSLFVEKGKTRKNLTPMAFQYVRTQPDEFMEKLRKEIEALINGD